jgi:hypothetical protein
MACPSPILLPVEVTPHFGSQQEGDPERSSALLPSNDRCTCVSISSHERETVVASESLPARTILSRAPGRPSLAAEVRQLIVQIASENATWGAPRIRGELLRLGFDLSERTVSRHLPRIRPGRGVLREWGTFLRNHREALAAMDFFTVPTVTFRVLTVWFLIHHGRRKIVHFDITEHPTGVWVIQQLREAFPYETAPLCLLYWGRRCQALSDVSVDRGAMSLAGILASLRDRDWTRPMMGLGG